MVEAAAQLDLRILSDKRDNSILIPTNKQISIFKRSGSWFLFYFLIIFSIVLLFRWIFEVPSNLYYPLLLVIVTLAYRQRERISGIYYIDKEGLIVPYYWFVRKKILFQNLLKVTDDNIKDETAGIEVPAIRIILDTKLIKFNVSGMQPPNIFLSTEIYDSFELKNFADELTKRLREKMITPNTLAQRLTDQVNRAWEARWWLILLNSIDSISEFLFYVLIIEIFLNSTLLYSLWPTLGLILIGLYSLVVLFIQFINKPQAIIGVRPHELGPIIYNDDEILTSIRFIIICRPYSVNLKHCEVQYEEGSTIQVGKLKQIQPNIVEPGILTHGVAQINGNHTKSSGAKIQFTYKEREESTNYIYEIPIHW